MARSRKSKRATRVHRQTSQTPWVLVAISVVGLFAIGYLLGLVLFRAKPVPAANEGQLMQKLYNSSVMKVPDTDVTIRATKRVTEFGDLKNRVPPYGSVAFVEKAVNLPGDAIATLFAVNFTGSGDLMYLGVFAPQNGAYELKDAVFLGDRIALGLLTNNNNVVTVSYREHAPDQAMVDDPKVSVTKAFTYENGKLVTK